MNGSNGKNTKISGDSQVPLKVLAAAVVAASLATGAYFDIRNRITSLETAITDGMDQRWTPADDKAYMTLFAEANGLDAPEHARVTEVER